VLSSGASVYAAAATGGIRQVLSLIIGILAFALISVLCYLGLRWISRRGFSGMGSKHMKVIDRLAVGRDSYLLMLQVSGRILLVSVGKEGSSLLCELRAEDLGVLRPEEGAKEKGAAGFGKRMAHNLKLNMGLLPKGTKPLGPPDKTGEPTPGETAERFQMILERIQNQQEKAAENENPVFPGRVDEGKSGLGRIDGANGKKLDYQAEIDSMMKNSRIPEQPPEPQRRPSKTGHVPVMPAGQAYAAYRPSPAQNVSGGRTETPEQPEAGSRPEADEKIDMIFDRIAKRKSKYKANAEGDRHEEK
jgi:flagellar biogenesis protein FliO